MNWQSLLNCTLFGALGVLLVTLGFKAFDLILHKVDLEQEVAKGNIAASIFSAAALIAFAIIIATAIH